MSKTLYTYAKISVPESTLVRYGIYDVSSIIVDVDGQDQVIPQLVSQGDTAHFWDTRKLARLHDEAFRQCQELNGGKPRKAEPEESVALAAELRAMPLDRFRRV